MVDMRLWEVVRYGEYTRRGRVPRDTRTSVQYFRAVIGYEAARMLMTTSVHGLDEYRGWLLN